MIYEHIFLYTYWLAGILDTGICPCLLRGKSFTHKLPQTLASVARRFHRRGMTLKRAWLFIATLCLTAGCEKFDPEPEEEKETAEHVVPTSLGRGTQTSPYTISQVIAGDSVTTKVSWFIGYVVGSTYSTMQNAVFDAETSYTSNILVSSDSTCEEISLCVPVELSTVSLQKAFSLHYNSKRFRQCIMVNGRFGQYFRTNGIRDVQTCYWLPGFDISTIKTAPTEWQERDERY